VNLHTQPVTVAVADADRDRRAGYERLIQGEAGITLLTNVVSSNKASNDGTFVERRLNPRIDVTASEDEVARIKRLKPLVLLVNLNQCADEDCAFLLSLRRECPEALMVLLTDDSILERQIVQALEIGARGFLKYETVQLHLSKAVRVVGRGEAWVPRKMLGDLMGQLLN
jgi:DNA-binding NarL/FixJ family response regulator